MRLGLALCSVALIAPTLGAAEFVLQLPLGAKATYSEVETTLAAKVPVGPFADGVLPTEDTPQNIRRTVFAMGGEQTVAEVRSGIADQLERSGYDEILSCVARDCGGYDFRFAIDVVDEPMMRVDLRDFQFITAKQTVTENPAFVTFLLSKSPVSVYVQMTEYRPTPADGALVDTVETGPVASIGTPLEITGDVSTVLEGLTFDAGSTTLGADPNGALAALAEKLKSDESLRVLLVGHSDMSGSLEGNITVSRKRAESVRAALINDHGISADRLEAHGVGFLSPRATNETEEGAQKNRRVEAVFSR
ncbi:OmpA family protein [Amylibacter sp. IMCC11727]|uniref:OmpA family protein n=1 Tax=Amylibacter sp. IMCC11727 TaxID=3039851 RepID=UPI00244DDDE5|nr:OmpA family protein [Amylibacter sp. IMCC11727]WGI22032.1 OmpA family protein [Amylibacter sp. IMCC11727]